MPGRDILILLSVDRAVNLLLCELVVAVVSGINMHSVKHHGSIYSINSISNPFAW